MLFDFECREICFRIIADVDNVGFIKTNYQKYSGIIVIEKLGLVWNSQSSPPYQQSFPHRTSYQCLPFFLH